MKRSLALLITLLFCSCMAADKPVPAEAKRTEHAPKPVASVYRVKASVIPDSLVIHAEIEIDVQNIDRDTFNLFWFAEAPEKTRRETGQTCKISQLEVNGSPVLSGRFSDDSSTALVKLATPLAPGERVAVSLVLDARMTKADKWEYSDATGILFRNWVPRVVLGSDHIRRRIFFVDQPSDFELSISIDSGWFVVAPGELLNDKSLLGVLPNYDTLLIDIIHHPYTADSYTFSRLPSEHGKDTYDLRKRYIRGYDFLVLKGYLLDRGRRGDYTVDAYYPQELASKWEYRLAEMGIGLNRSIETQERKASNESTKIVALGKKSKWYASGIRLIGAK